MFWWPGCPSRIEHNNCAAMTGTNMPYPTISNLPVLTTAQMIEVDRRMMDEIGITLYQMMENAGLQLANVARDVFLGGNVKSKRVAVLAGSGGNGGGAIVAARRLTNWGAICDLGLGRTGRDLSEVPQAQFEILKKIAPITMIEPEAVNSDYDLIIDGLIGYSLSGAPRGRAAEFINAANAAKAAVLSLDVPSGFDAAVGAAQEPCIRAEVTMTLALPKFGMIDKNQSAYVGRLLCADISCPTSAFANLGLKTVYETPFSKSPVVQLA